MANIMKYIVPLVVGVLIGLFIYWKFLSPEFEETTTVTEKQTIDTTFNEVSEVIEFDSLLYQSLSDSIDYYRKL